MAAPEVVIITGMSGAGRTEALHALEDAGFFCIDNLPPTMLPSLVSGSGLPPETGGRLAVVCDLRSRELFGRLCSELEHLRADGVSCRMVFLDADDDTLRRRYSSLRRRHPLAEGSGSVSEAIRRERMRLSVVRERANIVVDTSNMRARDLRALLVDEFANAPAAQGLNVSVFSFGYKYGVPLDADLVMDVRFLPNPFYDPELRDLTGLDEAVRSFVVDRDETRAFTAAWFNLLDVTMPGYVAEGKQHLSIAVGCTGGQHRSVAIAEATATHLRGRGYGVTVVHRDLARRGPA